VRGLGANSVFQSGSRSSSRQNNGGIKRFSCKENFGKILKVSHFSLGFSSNKNNNEIKHFQRVLLDFSGPRLEKL